MDVGIKRLDPLVLRNVQNGVLHHLVCMVVDQNVDCTHGRQRRLDRFLARLRRSQVRLVQVDLAAAVLDHLLGVVGVALLCGEVRDEHLCPLHGVEDGDGAADARVAAGDQGFAALELAGCFVSLHAAVEGRDLVDFWHGVHLGFQAGLVLALGSWGLPACVVVALVVWFMNAGWVGIYLLTDVEGGLGLLLRHVCGVLEVLRYVEA